MAITSSAKKAMRVSAKRRVFNLRHLRAMRSLTKKALVERGESLRLAQQAIDKAAKHGVIKKNTAARKKSKLVKAIRRSA